MSPKRVAVICLVLAAPALAIDPRTYELTDGRFTQLPGTQPARDVAIDPQLQRIETLLDQGRFGTAKKQLVPWLRGNATSPDYPLGLYLMARSLFGDGQPVRAFYYCDQLMDEFPTSNLFAAALGLQYEMADTLLDGKLKLKAFGFAILSGKTEAVEMLFRIQSRSPGSPLAQKSLRRTADYYFADGQFDLSADAYAVLARSYPRSPDVGEVKLRQAFSNYAQFNGTRFDATPLVNARTQMVELQTEFPDIAERENIAGFIVAIDETLARKLAVTADYYRRTGQAQAAVVTYRTLRDRYPNTDAAGDALRRLRDMKAEPDEPNAPGTPVTPTPDSVPDAPPAVRNPA